LLAGSEIRKSAGATNNAVIQYAGVINPPSPAANRVIIYEPLREITISFLFVCSSLLPRMSRLMSALARGLLAALVRLLSRPKSKPFTELSKDRFSFDRMASMHSKCHFITGDSATSRGPPLSFSFSFFLFLLCYGIMQIESLQMDRQLRVANCIE